MLIKTLLNSVEKHKGFVYLDPKLVLVGTWKQIHVWIRPRKGCKGLCSICLTPGPTYDTLGERRFQFVPLWGMVVYFLYVERSTWSEGQGRGAPRQRPKSTVSGPAAVDRAPCTSPSAGTCAAARSPVLGPIVSRFCRDTGLSRDKPLNSGSYGPLSDHSHNITNVASDRRMNCKLRPIIRFRVKCISDRPLAPPRARDRAAVRLYARLLWTPVGASIAAFRLCPRTCRSLLPRPPARRG